MMTLTSRGGSTPIEMASMRMECSARLLRHAGSRRMAPASKYRDVFSWRGRDQLRLKARGPNRPCFESSKLRSSVGPGEGDLVERLGPELLRGARHHAAAQRAVKFRRAIVVGERPDHHALQAALQQVAPRRGE